MPTMPPDVLHRLRDAAEPLPKSGAEHRGEDRVAVGATVAVTVMPTDAYSAMCTVTMKVADFSNAGMGLLAGDVVSIGCDLIVQLPKNDGGGGTADGHFSLRCVVCSCKAV